MPRLTDPDRLAAYRDALGNWNVEGYVTFELTEQAQRWIERNLGGLEYREIKQLMYEYVAAGGEIDEVREEREGWKELHEFHHDLRFTIQSIPVYIESRLIYRPPFKPDQPEIMVVNVHEQ